MGLVNCSDEYWKIVDQAERYYWAKANAYSISERQKIAEQSKAFADRLIEKYGFDSEVRYIIDKFYLDRD